MSPNTPSTRNPDGNTPQVNTHTHSVSGSVSLRAHTSTEPPNGKIANLQKGLILIVNGTEAVGEGTGFGLPILVYSDETYFSGTSSVSISKRDGHCVIRKEFTMDRVARNSFRNVTLENRAARTLITRMSDTYQKHRRFRFLALKHVTGRMSIGKTFPAAASMGKVTVTYAVDKSRIAVRADFNSLESRELRKVFMLNEQGSRFFSRYSDSEGNEFTGDEIGAWDTVPAEWACLRTAPGEIGFRLYKVEDSVLRRGREFLEGSLDWAGLDYELTRWNGVFEYIIDVLGV